MSKEFPQFSEEDANKAPVKAKRVSSVRVRKPASDKTRKTANPEKKEEKSEARAGDAEVVKAPTAEASVRSEEKPAVNADAKWEEAVPESVGGVSGGSEGGGGKRKRRRRKGKGGGASQVVDVAEGSQVAAPIAAAAVPQAPRTRVDPETLGKAAWKIYLAEVSEEGVALIGDQDARELARRCFRLAEIFLEERGRRG